MGSLFSPKMPSLPPVQPLPPAPSGELSQEEKDRIATWLAAFALVALFVSIGYVFIVGC